MTASNHSRRLSCSNASINNIVNGIGSPKIVEMVTISGRPKSRKSRTNISKSDFDDNPSFYAPSTSQSINCPTQDQRNSKESDWGLTGEECRFSTAQSTPRFTNSSSYSGSVIGPTTPKSVCNDNLLFREYGNNFTKNYMASTQSFKAKLRSHSAPKQRPEFPKKRLSINEMMESRNSFSGVRMQRSCSQAQEVVDFKNAVMGKLHKSNESIRETDKNCFHQRML